MNNPTIVHVTSPNSRYRTMSEQMDPDHRRPEDRWCYDPHLHDPGAPRPAERNQGTKERNNCILHPTEEVRTAHAPDRDKQFHRLRPQECV